MVDVSAIDQILSYRLAAFLVVVINGLVAFRLWVILPALFQHWLAKRRAVAEEKAADWGRLRDEVKRLSERLKEEEDECVDLRRALRECESSGAEWMRRAIKSEAFQQGRAEVRQAAAHAAAEQRADPAKAPEALKAAERLRDMGDGGK